MNLSLIGGWVVCIVLVLYGMLSAGEANQYWDPASLFITVGGSIGCMIASMPTSQLKEIPKYFKIAIFPPKYDPLKCISDIVEYATVARSKGLLALEESASQVSDPFMKQALMLIVDANDPDKVREMLETAVDNTAERHQAGSGFMGSGVSLGPAFGMIGTLVGLVAMLYTMNDDPGGLGEKMAVALITTFYGSLEANVIFAPLESALKNAHADEELYMNLVIEGVMAIAGGSNPRLIQEKLEFMLSKSSVKKASKAK